MIITRSSVAELEDAPEFDRLVPEYAAESHIEGMPVPDPQWQTYRALESLGMLHVFSATEEGKLVGFMSIIVTVLPRYGVPIVVGESYFVAKAHRGTGAGWRLLQAAESEVRKLGSSAILLSAPLEGDLAKALPKMGYRPCSTVFFKRLTDA